MAELSLALNVDARQAVKGVKDFGKALDDVVEDLDDVSDAGDKTERSLEASFRDIAKAAKTTGDKIESDVGDGLKDAGKEAGASGKEAAASFSGGFDDVTGFLQETAANAFEGFGPAGAAAGAAAAIGIGLVTAAFDAAEEKRKALEEKSHDLANAYIEAGASVLDAMALSSRIADIATSDDQQTKDDLRDLTAALGDRALALRVLAGDTGAMATAQDLLNQKQDTLADSNFITQSGKRKSALGQEKEAVEDLVRILGEQSGVQKSAKEQAEDYSQALKQMVESSQGATVQVDDLGNALYTLPDKTQVVVDAKTGQATTNVKNFHGDVDALPKTHLTDIQAKVSVDDRAMWRLINNPPTLYIPGRIVRPGTRQPI